MRDVRGSSEVSWGLLRYRGTIIYKVYRRVI